MQVRAPRQPRTAHKQDDDLQVHNHVGDKEAGDDPSVDAPGLVAGAVQPEVMQADGGEDAEVHGEGAHDEDEVGVADRVLLPELRAAGRHRAQGGVGMSETPLQHARACIIWSTAGSCPCTWQPYVCARL